LRPACCRPQHFAGGIIPMLPCGTLPILLWRNAFPLSRDTIRIERVEPLGDYHE
jgi:hypothetical protein